MTEQEPIRVVIDTNKYAGNFEREMCAFVTGQYGECGVGEEIAGQARDEIEHVGWWDNHVEMVEDEHGCARPVAVCATPGWFNDGFGGLHCDLLGRREALEAAASGLGKALSLGERSLEAEIAALPAGDPRRVDRQDRLANLVRLNEQRVESLRSGRDVHPAYMSVAIFVDEMPPPEVLEELKMRAEAFAEQHDGGGPRTGTELAMTGLRVVGAGHSPSGMRI